MSNIRDLATLRRGDLGLAGGKAANLGELIAADLPVPQGFCVTTTAYLGFVEAHGLMGSIRRILDAARLDDPGSLESASQDIRALFEAGSMGRPRPLFAQPTSRWGGGARTSGGRALLSHGGGPAGHELRGPAGHLPERPG